MANPSQFFALGEKNLFDEPSGFLGFYRTKYFKQGGVGPIEVSSTALPCWAFIFGFGVLPSIMLVRRLRLARRRVHGRCLRCGYDLRATPDRGSTELAEVCPECGAAPPVQTVPPGGWIAESELEAPMPQLHYQPRGRIRRKWLRWRTGAIIVVAVAVALSVYRFLPYAAWWIQVSYQLHCCKTYVIPSNAPVDTELFDTASGLFKQFSPPPPLAKLQRCVANPDVVPIFTDCPTVFLHERRTAGGRSRLVIVYLRPETCAVGIVEFRGVSLKPGDCFAKRNGSYTVAVGQSFRVADAAIEVYPGVVDPSDEEAFSFRYVGKTTSGVIKARLRDATAREKAAFKEDVVLEYVPTGPSRKR
jgi:hypothetical protein